MSIKEISRKIDIGFFDLSQKYGFIFLESSIGLIYIWFGALKFFPGLSPAEALAADTLDFITFHLFEKQYLIKALALVEVVLGIFLLVGTKSKYTIWVLLVHMGGTLTPIILFPDLIFTNPPFGFSMIGQYIMKNLIIIGAAIVIYNQKTLKSRSIP